MIGAATRLVRRRAGANRQGQAGFTFIELTMGIAIASIFALGLYGAYFATVELGRSHESQARAQADARTAMDRLAREVRQSVSADNGLTTPVDRVTPTELVLHVDPDRDPAELDPVPHRVRYRVVDDALVRERALPIGTAPPYSYGSYGAREVLVEGIENGTVPLFAGFTIQGASLPATVNPPATRDVAQVRIRLFVASRNGQDTSNPTEFTTDAALRNVIDL